MEAEERPSKVRKLSHDGQGLDGSDGKLQADLVTDGSTKQPSPPSETTGASAPASVASAANGEDTHDSDVIDVEAGDVASPLQGSAQEGAPATAPMSKNALKRLRRKEEWEAGRDDRKARRKEKLVAQRERKREAKKEAIAKGEPLPRTQQQQRFRQGRPVQVPITIVIDCDFDDLMRDGERISLASQLTRVYSDNKIAKYQVHLAVSSFGGQLKERFDGLMRAHYLSWKGVKFLGDDFVETSRQAQEWMSDESHGGQLAGPVFSKYAAATAGDEAQTRAREEGETIYLSSDSDYTLTELKPYSTYIIGGLVDKNREKGICHKRAVAAGVKTAKLPISEFMDMTSRKVLATNHVNEIMIKYLECGDWGQAFTQVIPKRKAAKLKGQDQGISDGEEHEEDDDDADKDVERSATEVEARLEEEVQESAPLMDANVQEGEAPTISAD